MAIYQVTASARGPAKVRKVQESDGDVVLLFNETGAFMFDLVTKEGIDALADNADFAHLLDYTHGLPLKESIAHANPGVHALVFGE